MEKVKYEWQVIEVGNRVTLREPYAHHEQDNLRTLLNDGWEAVTTAPYIEDGTTQYVEYTLRRPI